MITTDDSVMASWCFPDQGDSHAEAAFQRMADESVIAPTLLWFELRNVLLMGERRDRLSEAQTARFLNFVRELPIEMDRDPNEALVLGLARTHRLSVYDAVYLELAQRRALPLATLDKALILAARSEQIPLVGEES